jgi:hypothetical protein
MHVHICWRSIATTLKLMVVSHFFGHTLAKAGNSQISVAFIECLVVRTSSIVGKEGCCYDKLVIACNHLLPSS